MLPPLIVKKSKLQRGRAVIPSRPNLTAGRLLRSRGDQGHCGSAGELIEWARILAYITGVVAQELLLRNEYLVAENRILKAQLKGRLRLSDVERAKLGEIGHRLGPKGPRRGGDRRPTARHHLGMVPKTRRSQVRRIAGTSSPRPTTPRQRH
jgi:hypothetical protein